MAGYSEGLMKNMILWTMKGAGKIGVKEGH